MNRFSEDNLKNIKALVENGTGVTFDHKKRYHISARSLLIAALIIILGSMTVFAAYQISLSKGIIGGRNTDTESVESSFMISRPFGEGPDPLIGAESLHEGIDMPAAPGTEVLAAASGKVKETGYDMERGNYVVLEHEGGYTTVYAHMEEVCAEEGQRVESGTVIGTVGSTGMSTGPHLHFELRLNGEAIDPEKYWDDSADVSKSPLEESGDTAISPEFMELLESYEETAYEYLEFLKSYDENDEKQNEVFREISTGYLDIDRQLIEWEKRGLNEAEEKAYKEVLERVGEKWIEAGVAAG